MRISRRLLLVSIAIVFIASDAFAQRTMRFDYYHTGSVELFEKVWARLASLGPVPVEFRMAVEAAQARMACLLPPPEPPAQANGEPLQ